MRIHQIPERPGRSTVIHVIQTPKVEWPAVRRQIERNRALIPRAMITDTGEWTVPGAGKGSAFTESDLTAGDTRAVFFTLEKPYHSVAFSNRIALGFDLEDVMALGKVSLRAHDLICQYTDCERNCVVTRPHSRGAVKDYSMMGICFNLVKAYGELTKPYEVRKFAKIYSNMLHDIVQLAGPYEEDLKQFARAVNNRANSALKSASYLFPKVPRNLHPTLQKILDGIDWSYPFKSWHLEDAPEVLVYARVPLRLSKLYAVDGYWNEADW